MDDDAVDAAGKRGRGGGAEGELRKGARGRGDVPARGGARARGARRGRRGARAPHGRRAGRALLLIRGAAVRARRSPPWSRADPRGPVRHHRGRNRHRAPRTGLRRGRLSGRSRRGPAQAGAPRGALQPGSRRRHLRRARALGKRRHLRGALRQGRCADGGADRGPARARAAAARGALRARIPALLAMRDAAALLREIVLVHRDLAAARGAAARQRLHQLVPAARQARPFWRLACQQRRLGALARALLGHPAAGVALRGWAPARDRFLRPARRARGDDAVRPPSSVRRPRAVPVPARGRAAGGRAGGSLRAPHDPRAGGHRRVVRLRGDALRPAPLPVRARRALPRALPGRLHMRGAGPDARLVLLAARGRDAAGQACALSQRGVPRPDPRRGGPEDVEVQGQRSRAMAGARDARRRRLPLVLLRLQATVGRLSLLRTGDRRRGAPVPEAAVEHLLLLRPVCARGSRGARALAGAHGAPARGSRPLAAEGAVRDQQLEEAMADARETVRLGLGARRSADLKVRQPLAEAVVLADGRERRAIEGLAEIVREELNVRRVRFVAAAEELGTYEVKPNYRTLGPLFGKDMPLAAEAIAALDPARVAAALRGGEDANGIGISVAGREHKLSADDVILTMRAPAGYAVEREGGHAVALDLTIDEELLQEGRAREGAKGGRWARPPERCSGCRDASLRGGCGSWPRPPKCGSGRREHRPELLLELLLGIGADDRLHGLSAFEEDHGRDREHLELRRRLLVLVGVELHDAKIGAL